MKRDKAVQIGNKVIMRMPLFLNGAYGIIEDIIESKDGSVIYRVLADDFTWDLARWSFDLVEEDSNEEEQEGSIRE